MGKRVVVPGQRVRIANPQIGAVLHGSTVCVFRPGEWARDRGALRVQAECVVDGPVGALQPVAGVVREEQRKTSVEIIFVDQVDTLT